MAVIKDLDEGGFETELTQQNLEDLLSGVIEARVRLFQYDDERGCYLDGDGLKPGTKKMVTQNINFSNVEAFKKGQFKDFAQVAMIPAGMARKHRIKALETTAADPNQSEAQRHRAWDDAGKLKALHKEEAERRRELLRNLAEKVVVDMAHNKGGSHD